jgi:hypothetical protein
MGHKGLAGSSVDLEDPQILEEKEVLEEKGDTNRTQDIIDQIRSFRRTGNKFRRRT